MNETLSSPHGQAAIQATRQAIPSETGTVAFRMDCFLANPLDERHLGSQCFHLQVPDAYRFREILACFPPSNPCGHPAVQRRQDACRHNVFRDRKVFKVTHPDDIEIAELMQTRRFAPS